MQGMHHLVCIGDEVILVPHEVIGGMSSCLKFNQEKL